MVKDVITWSVDSWQPIRSSAQPKITITIWEEKERNENKTAHTDSCIYFQKPVTPSVLGSILTKRCRGLLLKSTVWSTWFFPAVSSPTVILLPSIVSRCSRCSSSKLEGTEMNPNAVVFCTTTLNSKDCRMQNRSQIRPETSQDVATSRLVFPFSNVDSCEM